MQVASGFGVNLRDAPGGQVISSLPDGTPVQPYLESQQEVDGIAWVRVDTLDGLEGWLAAKYLIQLADPIEEE
jgi:hypothetical protein